MSSYGTRPRVSGQLPESGTRGGSGGRSGLELGLDVELDLDLVADHGGRDAAADAEVRALDLGAGRDAEDLGVRAVAEAAELAGQGHGLGHAVQRQVAVDLDVLAVDAHRGRREGQVLVLLDVQEVGRADVAV